MIRIWTKPVRRVAHRDTSIFVLNKIGQSILKNKIWGTGWYELRLKGSEKKTDRIEPWTCWPKPHTDSPLSLPHSVAPSLSLSLYLSVETNKWPRLRRRRRSAPFAWKWPQILHLLPIPLFIPVNYSSTPRYTPTKVSFSPAQLYLCEVGPTFVLASPLATTRSLEVLS